MGHWYYITIFMPELSLQKSEDKKTLRKVLADFAKDDECREYWFTEDSFKLTNDNYKKADFKGAIFARYLKSYYPVDELGKALFDAFDTDVIVTIADAECEPAAPQIWHYHNRDEAGIKRRFGK